MHRVQLPQRSAGGASAARSEGVSSSVVNTAPKKKPRPHLLIQHQRVFPNPPDPRMLRKNALLQRPGVGIRQRFERLFESLAQLRHQRIQSAPQHIVIVVAPRISRNPSARLAVAPSRESAPAAPSPSLIKLNRPRQRAVVVHPANNHAPRTRQNTRRIAPPRIARDISSRPHNPRRTTPPREQAPEISPPARLRTNQTQAPAARSAIHAVSAAVLISFQLWQQATPARSFESDQKFKRRK